MGQLLQIEDHWIDPDRVISVAPFGGDGNRDKFFINVNMGDWTASYAYTEDEYGWTADSAAEAINAARS